MGCDDGRRWIWDGLYPQAVQPLVVCTHQTAGGHTGGRTASVEHASDSWGVPASGATAGCELASDSWRGHDSSATNSRHDTLLVPLTPLPPDGTTLEGTQCFSGWHPSPKHCPLTIDGHASLPTHSDRNGWPSIPLDVLLCGVHHPERGSQPSRRCCNCSATHSLANLMAFCSVPASLNLIA